MKTLELKMLMAQARERETGDFLAEHQHPVLVVLKPEFNPNDPRHDLLAELREGARGPIPSGPHALTSSTRKEWEAETTFRFDPSCPVLVIEKPSITVGRQRENDFWLPGLRVSKSHAVLAKAGSVWTLKDVGSANGTLLDGVRLAAEVAVPLPECARIGFGPDVQVQFCTGRALLGLLRAL